MRGSVPTRRVGLHSLLNCLFSKESFLSHGEYGEQGCDYRAAQSRLRVVLENCYFWGKACSQGRQLVQEWSWCGEDAGKPGRHECSRVYTGCSTELTPPLSSSNPDPCGPHSPSPCHAECLRSGPGKSRRDHRDQLQLGVANTCTCASSFISCAWIRHHWLTTLLHLFDPKCNLGILFSSAIQKPPRETIHQIKLVFQF